MVRKASIVGAILAVGYIAGLVAAIGAGNNDATIALIAVGGPVVGAAAGVVGALAGATTQAQGARETAILTADSQARMKDLELNSARALKTLELEGAATQMRLEATFAWADRLYADLREFLTLSKLYGVEETTQGSQTQGIERLRRQQELDTLRDMLRLNPLVEADSSLADRVNLAARAVQYSIMDLPLDKGEAPPGVQLNELAAAVGRQLLNATGTAPGLSATTDS